MLDRRWQNLKEIFHTAVVLSPHEREAYLDQACNGDLSLRRQVEELLRSHEETGNFVDAPAYQAAAEMWMDGLELKAGSKVAHYRILSLLGEGGMGRVYLAEDTKLHRKVSLKFLSADVTKDHERLRRFEQEARTASALNHPNIITIHEIGEEDGHQFIATEFIDGQTLRERLRSPLDLDESLEIAIQVASALAAAHRVNIVHRDIKPENIMIRKDDGLVKVLDFGLAKMSVLRRATMDPEADTQLRNTAPGVVMGTAAYMSPEQARGETVDERADIWSLGVVLYEMIAGCSPFVASTSNEIISAILSRETPAPLTRYSRLVPERLEEIVEKALTKNKDERYQTSKDLLIDLKRLKQSLEVQKGLERSTSPQRLAASTSEGQSNSPTKAANRISSVQYVVEQVKNHKWLATVGLAVVALAVIGTLFWRFTRTQAAPVLTDKDTLLLADFDNKTGDGVFDGALKQALAVQLSQSPFLSIFPETNVRQALKLMDRSPDERVFGEIAREICERQGLKAFITGSIVPLGSHYLLTLEAIHGLNGESLARAQVEAESKEKVLLALSQATSALREKLGESLTSIEKFDKPVEVTTSSLEALKAFSLGVEQQSKGSYREAMPFIKRAIELDPNFANAHSNLATLYANTDQPRHAAESAARAYSLQDNVTERERLRIINFYHSYVTHDLEKSIETLEVWRLTYPREVAAPTNLSAVYAWIGQPEKSAEAARDAIRLNPNHAVPQFNLAFALTRLNRFDEARDVLERALQQKFDNSDIRYFLYMIYSIREDSAGMQRQFDWTKGRADEYVALKWQAKTASLTGRWRESQDFWRRVIDLAVQSDAKEIAAEYAAEAAARGAASGQCVQAKAAAMQSVKLTPQESPQPGAVLALALCGESAHAQRLMSLPSKLYPKDTRLNGLWLPTIQAAIELRRGNAQRALEQLQSASRYEVEAYYWPQTLRAQAYLKLNRPTEAAAEYQKIIENRGQDPLSALYPLAYLGLARVAAKAGDVEKSRKAYEEFLKLWKDADGELSPLIEARREYERLMQVLH